MQVLLAKGRERLTATCSTSSRRWRSRLRPYGHFGELFGGFALGQSREIVELLVPPFTREGLTTFLTFRCRCCHPVRSRSLFDLHTRGNPLPGLASCCHVCSGVPSGFRTPPAQPAVPPRTLATDANPQSADAQPQKRRSGLGLRRRCLWRLRRKGRGRCGRGRRPPVYL